jgi:hypothetical protein
LEKSGVDINKQDVAATFRGRFLGIGIKSDKWNNAILGSYIFRGM